MFSKIYWFIRDLLSGKPIVLGGRSSLWNKVRKEHLKKFPNCAVCGEKGQTVHHIKVFHKFPELELDSQNLLTACNHCHLKFCHLGSFKSWNETIKQDSLIWQEKRKNRPK